MYTTSLKSKGEFDGKIVKAMLKWHLYQGSESVSLDRVEWFKDSHSQPYVVRIWALLHQYVQLTCFLFTFSLFMGFLVVHLRQIENLCICAYSYIHSVQKSRTLHIGMNFSNVLSGFGIKLWNVQTIKTLKPYLCS